MRIFAASDLHVDFGANRDWLNGLSPTEYLDDALVVAGDIAHRLEVVASALELLKGRFREVFYVPGNHEMWVRGESGDSLEKFARLLKLCQGLEVHTQMRSCGEWWIAPLFSWYCEGFDTEDRGDALALEAWGDFRFCRWPSTGEEPHAFFARLNDEAARPATGRVLTFSHFLPRFELLPSIEHLRFKGLPKVAGCSDLERQLRALNAEIHVFGHSHIPWDEIIDGVRYLQRPLGYPQERRGREFALAQIA
jgi:predicted phosphodiesterase